VAGLYLIAWVSAIRRYMLLLRQGVPICAVRYEDLVAHPQQVLESLFEYCSLPVSQVPRGLRALEEDAQGDTPLARNPGTKRYLSERNVLKIRQLLQGLPDIQTPDFILPGTLALEGSVR